MPSAATKRTLFARLHQLGMTSSEYVYILLDQKSLGFGEDSF